MSKKFSDSVDNELCISGTVLATQSEPLRWNDKTTGMEKSAIRFSVILQGKFGIVFARAFNPSDDLTSIKVGDLVYLPIEKFEKENGMKIATLNRGV